MHDCLDLGAGEVHSQAFVHSTSERFPRVPMNLVFASILGETFGIETLGIRPVLRHVVREVRGDRNIRSRRHEVTPYLSVADRSPRHDRYGRDESEAFLHHQVKAAQAVEICIAGRRGPQSERLGTAPVLPLRMLT